MHSVYNEIGSSFLGVGDLGGSGKLGGDHRSIVHVLNFG